MGKVWDLMLCEKRRLLVRARQCGQKCVATGKHTKYKDVCLKWRLSMVKMAWVDKREGLVLVLPPPGGYPRDWGRHVGE